MRLTLADESLSDLEPHVTPARSMELLVELALSRVGHIGPMDRHIVLGETEINTLETRLQCPSLSDAKGLIAAVDNLADVRVQKISLQFTPSQLQELKARSEREGQSVEEYTRRVVQAMIPMFFQTAPAQGAPVLVGKGK